VQTLRPSKHACQSSMARIPESALWDAVVMVFAADIEAWR